MHASANEIEAKPTGTRAPPVWAVIAVGFIVSRVLLIASALLAPKLFTVQPQWLPPGDIPRWLAMWCRWDSQWYLDIAQNGYSLTPGVRSNIVFPPLFPMLMRGGGYLLGHDAKGLLLSGFIISNLLLLAAMFYLYRLIRLDYDFCVAKRAVAAYMVFPTTLFLSAVYPMSAILLIATAAFYYARIQRWWLAGMIAGLACLARPEGAIIGASLGIEYLAQRKFQLRKCGWDLLAFGLPLLTLGSWMAFLWVKFDDPLAFVTNQKYWQAQRLGLARHHWEPAFGALTAAVILTLSGVAWFKLRPSYAFMSTACILLYVSAPRWISLPRMAMAIFPVAILLPLLVTNKNIWRIAAAMSMLAACGFMIRFVSNHFVG